MEKLVITGNTRLEGEISVVGAKNSSIAILPATLLCNGICTLHNIPNIIAPTINTSIITSIVINRIQRIRMS